MYRSILNTTLLAGTLDIVAACLKAYFTSGTTPSHVLAYIASGLLGKTANAGGTAIQVLGLTAHYLITLACTICFYWAYPKWKILHISTILNAFLICSVAWLVTTQLIVRFSHIGPQPILFNQAVIAFVILLFCIGFPIAWRAQLYFKNK